MDSNYTERRNITNMVGQFRVDKIGERRTNEWCRGERSNGKVITSNGNNHQQTISLTVKNALCFLLNICKIAAANSVMLLSLVLYSIIVCNYCSIEHVQSCNMHTASFGWEQGGKEVKQIAVECKLGKRMGKNVWARQLNWKRWAHAELWLTKFIQAIKLPYSSDGYPFLD